MQNQKFEISNVNKMLVHLEAIEDLYRDLSDDTKERFFNEFPPQNRPDSAINSLSITLYDCLDILQER